MMEISKEKKEKKKRIVPIWVCILIFIGAFFAGMISKVAIKPAWSTKYTATWSEELGTKITDISYGEANKFDLYLPKDSTKDTYGFICMQVVLHPEIRQTMKICLHGFAVKDMLQPVSIIPSAPIQTMQVYCYSPTRLRKLFL